MYVKNDKKGKYTISWKQFLYGRAQLSISSMKINQIIEPQRESTSEANNDDSDYNSVIHKKPSVHGETLAVDQSRDNSFSAKVSVHLYAPPNRKEQKWYLPKLRQLHLRGLLSHVWTTSCENN